MTCKICGRSACTESFHSFAAQEAADAQSEAPDDGLPLQVMEAINSYAKYYADNFNLGMSVRDDMIYVAKLARRR